MIIDVIRTLNAIPWAVDVTAHGIWDQVSSEYSELISEARGRIDEAVALLQEHLPRERHRYVREEHVAMVAAALAFDKLEGWDAAIEWAIEWVAADAIDWSAFIRGE